MKPNIVNIQPIVLIQYTSSLEKKLVIKGNIKFNFKQIFNEDH